MLIYTQTLRSLKNLLVCFERRLRLVKTSILLNLDKSAFGVRLERS